MIQPLHLQGLQGQVLRLRGVVDRFGSFEQQGRIIHTLCIRNLELAASEQPIAPDHWWFRLRQTWSESGVQAGDTVLFTVKVRCCSLHQLLAAGRAAHGSRVASHSIQGR